MTFSVDNMCFIRAVYTKINDDTASTFELLIPDRIAANMFGYDDDGNITNMPAMDMVNAMLGANGIAITSVEVFGNCNTLITSEKLPHEG